MELRMSSGMMRLTACVTRPLQTGERGWGGMLQTLAMSNFVGDEASLYEGVKTQVLQTWKKKCLLCSFFLWNIRLRGQCHRNFAAVGCA